jgi:CRISPR-associated protein Csm3
METNNNFARLILTGKIRVLTGMRVGGSKETLNVGEVDSNVIKTPDGVPYIPGTSLKGKLRSELAQRAFSSTDIQSDPNEVKQIFGSFNDLAKIRVRDAFACLDKNGDWEDLGSDNQMDFSRTELKHETAIERRTGKAKNGSLRKIERVPPNATFSFEIVFESKNDAEDSDFKNVILAMRLLEDSAVGSKGSSGYGKIKFESINIRKKNLIDYEKNTPFDTLQDVTATYWI